MEHIFETYSTEAITALNWGYFGVENKIKLNKDKFQATVLLKKAGWFSQYGAIRN